MTTVNATLRQMLAAARASKCDPAIFGILADLLEELGAEDMVAMMRQPCPQWGLHEVEIACFDRKLLLWSDEPEWRKACELHDALDAVDPYKVPLMAGTRTIGQKEQAKRARQLFKTLRIPHLSVTCARGSMCYWVEIRMPKRKDYERDAQDDVIWGCEARCRNQRSEEKLRRILDLAFPAHLDRSDSSRDYFDISWAIS